MPLYDTPQGILAATQPPERPRVRWWALGAAVAAVALVVYEIASGSPNTLLVAAGVLVAVIGPIWAYFSFHHDLQLISLARAREDGRPGTFEVTGVRMRPSAGQTRPRNFDITGVVHPRSGKSYRGEWTLQRTRSEQPKVGERHPAVIDPDDPLTVFIGRAALEIDPSLGPSGSR